RIAVRIVSPCSVITPIVSLSCYGSEEGAPPRFRSRRPLRARRAARPGPARVAPDHARWAATPCWWAIAAAGLGRDLRPNRFQPVRLRLYLIRSGVQRMAHELGKIVPLCRGALGAVAGSVHNSRSRAARRAAMPRDV